MGSKYKEITSGNKRECQSSKKTKRKQPARYYGDARIKMEGINPCERCVCTG